MLAVRSCGRAGATKEITCAVSDRLKRHQVAAFGVLLVCSLALRLFIAFRTDQVAVIKENADAATYLSPAKTLLQQGELLDFYGRPQISRTPGYPVFLAALMAIVGQDPRRVLISQTIILSLEVVIFYVLAGRILKPLAAFIAGLLAAFSPWRAFLAGFPLSEGLFLFLLTSVLLAVILTAETTHLSGSLFGGAATGLLVSAAVLVRPVWPLVFLIAAALFFLFGPHRKGVWLVLALMLMCAVGPLLFWKGRNEQASHFNGLSDIAGQCAWQMLASRVLAQISSEDKWVVKEKAIAEENSWKLPIQETDQERWRRANSIFTQHPLLTVYFFVLSGVEHALHPSPDVLSPGKLNFVGDYWVLAALWGIALVVACVGWRFRGDERVVHGASAKYSLAGLAAISVMLTFSSGICFGAGFRYRVPLEVVVPILASMGLVGSICCGDTRGTAGNLKSNRIA